MGLTDFSIVSRSFLIALIVVTVAFLIGAVLVHRWWARLTLGVLAFVLAIATVASFVNAHFDYYPTFADLLGRRARDEAPLSALKMRDVPDRGVVVELPIPGTVSHFDARDAQVYVPPAWFRRPRPTLPVVMLLHGSPGTPEDWTRAGMADVTADGWAEEHKGEAPVIVMPDSNGSFTGDTECVNSDRGDAETYLTVDVPRFVMRRFGTETTGKRWAIAGLSEGGMCALMLTLRHPDLFQTFGDYSGLLGPRSGSTNALGSTVDGLFGGSRARYEAHNPVRLLRGNRYPELGGWFEVGTDDADPLAAERRLAPLARRAGIDTCLDLVPGGEHTFRVWSQAFRDSLPWMAARLGLTRMRPAFTSECERSR